MKLPSTSPSRWWAAALLAGMLGTAPSALWAHGQPELRVTPSVVVPGASIQLKGEGLTEGGEILLTLEGMTFEATLGTVVGDAEGAFTVELTVPVEALPGTYLVRAVGSDGKAASSEITINPAAPAPAREAGPGEQVAEEKPAPPPTEAGPALEPAPMPSAAEHEIPRSRSTEQLALILAGAGLSVGIGLFLVRGRD